ncbi:hypothetical protein A0H76_1057 [Hepatospora eriocheir]|uniref:Uncharacterized protein n=1 Tax=Hepatospora eriocheir TaxID=1081669 RepID=A0A1X0QHT6_9MICR|nr:hypothetical protein A0H76_1057 [Hepatospora eriocheir]
MNGNNYKGITIRYLIENYLKRRAVEFGDLKKPFDVNSVKMEEILESVKEYLIRLRLELVKVAIDKSVGKNKTITTYKYFLKKMISADDKHKEVTLDDKRLYTLFALIQINNNKIKEEYLEGCSLFKSVSINEWLKKIKGDGYIKTEVIETEVWWTTNWRYEIEYGDFFNVIDFFKGVVNNKV